MRSHRCFCCCVSFEKIHQSIRLSFDFFIVFELNLLLRLGRQGAGNLSLAKSWAMTEFKIFRRGIQFYSHSLSYLCLILLCFFEFFSTADLPLISSRWLQFVLWRFHILLFNFRLCLIFAIKILFSGFGGKLFCPGRN